MDSGDSCRRREGTSRGSHGFLVGAEFWPPTLRPARVFRGGRKSVAAQEETPAASPLLEDLRRRLVRAFQRAVPRGRSRRSREAAAAREERSRARVESALAGLRAELLEMRFQNRQLARTLLDLDMKMQQLKKEYELEMASESQSSEDNDVNLE
ncbi:alanine and arginine-rich domain-containing protein [Sus scrofa]|uniref:Alanine and arginine rich domain containing protein n=2 Tax=Sus scrofa TaxID=9823 RepID=A0A8D0QS89_PIG|nr:alanine and arginine-rich domain-containing protein [Sus scrofa]